MSCRVPGEVRLGIKGNGRFADHGVGSEGRGLLTCRKMIGLRPLINPKKTKETDGRSETKSGLRPLTGSKEKAACGRFFALM